eukprot:6270810-Alexandrium_andersonii.AAC.1
MPAEEGQVVPSKQKRSEGQEPPTKLLKEADVEAREDSEMIPASAEESSTARVEAPTVTSALSGNDIPVAQAKAGEALAPAASASAAHPQPHTLKSSVPSATKSPQPAHTPLLAQLGVSSSSSSGGPQAPPEAYIKQM